MKVNRHLEDEEIEQYSLRSIPESDMERVEDHLLICAECRNRVEESDKYVLAMRDGCRELREKPARSKFRLPFFALALATAVIVVSVYLPRSTSRGHLPFAVTLSAVRGSAGSSKAPAGQSLDLRLDLTGLPEYAASRVDIVDETGKSVARTILPETRIPPLPAGAYFVRVYSRGNELLREYGLELETRK